MADIGGKLDTLVALDSSLTVASGGAWTNGSSKDIGASTSPQPVWIAAQWSITNSGTTDGYDLDVIVQFSDDNVNWPDDGHGTALKNFYSSTAGDDLTRSEIVTFLCLLRYFRFQYANNNSTDNLSVSSETAENLYQSS